METEHETRLKSFLEKLDLNDSLEVIGMAIENASIISEKKSEEYLLEDNFESAMDCHQLTWKLQTLKVLFDN